MLCIAIQPDRLIALRHFDPQAAVAASSAARSSDLVLIARDVVHRVDAIQSPRTFPNGSFPKEI